MTRVAATGHAAGAGRRGGPVSRVPAPRALGGAPPVAP